MVVRVKWILPDHFWNDAAPLLTDIGQKHRCGFRVYVASGGWHTISTQTQHSSHLISSFLDEVTHIGKEFCMNAQSHRSIHACSPSVKIIAEWILVLLLFFFGLSFNYSNMAWFSSANGGLGLLMMFMVGWEYYLQVCEFAMVIYVSPLAQGKPASNLANSM